MKISNSKKQLAKIISESGGWRDGSLWATSDRDGFVSFFEGAARPTRDGDSWGDDRGDCEYTGGHRTLRGCVTNWHQTILSRDEYFHLYPAQDADGWIDCNGCDPQIDQDTVVEVKFRDGQLGHNPETVRVWCWTHGECDDDIIAYRLHKPEQAQPQSPVEMAFDIIKQGVKTETKPTIEQLAADYRNSKDYAYRKQAEADAAKDDADEALRKLELAGEAIGLIVTPVRVEKEPELVITDWRDLKVGDEVKAIVMNGGSDVAGEIGVIVELSRDGFWSDFPSQDRYYYFDKHFNNGDVVFIRRP